MGEWVRCGRPTGEMGTGSGYGIQGVVGRATGGYANGAAGKFAALRGSRAWKGLVGVVMEVGVVNMLGGTGSGGGKKAGPGGGGAMKVPRGKDVGTGGCCCCCCNC